MSVKETLDRLFGRGQSSADAKIDAEQSREALDRKITETHDTSQKVIARAREEIMHSKQIIAVAEQAIRSLRSSERHR